MKVCFTILVKEKMQINKEKSGNTIVFPDFVIKKWNKKRCAVNYFLAPFFSYPNVEAKRSILNALITELKSLEP